MGRAIAVLLGMLLAFEVPAVTTGTDLLKTCSESEDAAGFESGVCNGYVGAVADMMSNYPIAGLRACFPNDVTRSELISAFHKYLQEHSGVLHLSAYTNIASALALAYPCSRQR